MVSIDGSALKQSGLAGSKSTEESDGATAQKNQTVETEGSSVSLPHPMSANRKRHDNRKPAKGRAGGRLSSFAMPAIALVVGLALIVTFSGVLDRRPASNTRQPQTTNPPATVAAGNPAVPMQLGNPATDLQTLDAAFSESERAAEFLNAGTDFFQQGQFEAALTNYEAAVKLLPEDETAHFNHALALARLGKSDEAVAAYKEALRLFPDYAEAHNNLGKLLASQGRLAEASEHASQAIALTPENALAQNNFGTLLVRQGRLDEAVKHFSEAVRLMPDYLEARCNLGNAYATQGKYDLAAAEFQSVLQTKPDFEPALRGIARLNQQRQAPSRVPNSPVPLR